MEVYGGTKRATGEPGLSSRRGEREAKEADKPFEVVVLNVGRLRRFRAALIRPLEAFNGRHVGMFELNGLFPFSCVTGTTTAVGVNS